MQQIINDTNAGEEIDLSKYKDVTDYNATVNKSLTIKNGALKNAKLSVTAENVKLEKLEKLSVSTSSRLTINNSKLNDLLIGNATSESRASVADISMAMVSVAGCEIENVELNGFNSQLNIADATTKIDDIVTSTNVKVILEAGNYEGMKDPTVTDDGELVRIDMTKEKELSVYSIYSHPKKAEYQIGEKFDVTGLIVMGTYTASMEIFKSGGWKGEAVDSVTKWESEKDYTVTCEDFSTAGVKIVTITSNIDDNVKSNFFVYVKDSQNSEIKEPEITDITIKSLEKMSKTLYRVGERLDLSGFQVSGTYNGFEINLPYRSEPVYGEQLTAENTQITFYYNDKVVGTKEITVAEPCEVEFYDGIGESTLLYMLKMVTGESLQLPVEPKRDDYIFAGWYNGDEKIESGYKVTSTLKLTARWNNTKGYTVVFYANDTTDKSVRQAFLLDAEQSLIKNSFIREGYTFVGWAKKDSGEKVYDDCATVKNLTDKVNDEVALYAKWAANTYTVKFNANGGSGETADISFNYDEEKALTANAFTREDFTFAGWAVKADGDVTYTDMAKVKNLTSENNATVTLYAVWTEKDKVLPVIFSVPSKTAVDYNDSVTLSCKTEEAKISYTIDGVTVEYSNAIVITKDVNITAFATKDGMKNSDITTASYTVKTYTVTFNSEHGTTPEQISGLKKGDTLTAEQLPVLTTAGYTFAGWYNGENKIEAGYTITCDLELTAKWNANTDTAYTVEHYQQNIDNDEYVLAEDDTENKTGTTDEDTSAEAKTYAGFTAKSVTQEKIAADGSTVVKIYYDRNIITLTLNLDGGEGEKEITGKYGATVNVTVPTKNGYTFADWDSELPAIFTENVTYTATWTANVYTVKFDANGGNGNMGNQAFTYDVEKALSANVFTRVGYTFAGWATTANGETEYTNGKTVSNLTADNNGEVTLYAVWTAVTYTITYELNDGENAQSNPANYTVETGTITLADATKEKTAFCGWYIDESFTNPITKIEKGSTGNIILYAKWWDSTDFVYVEGATIEGKISDSEIFNDSSVTVGNFYICDHEVTQKEYSKVESSYVGTPTYGVGDNYPANFVSWYDALVYCNKRSMAEGLTPCYTIKNSTDPDDWGTVPTSSDSTWNAANCDFTANGYRLPKEAEWEYAARGGNGLTGTQYPYAGNNTIGEVAWYNKSEETGTKVVKEGFAPNGLGLYDMSGNVWEWCWESGESGKRSERGGCYKSGAEKCTVFYRAYYNVFNRYWNDGFRVVRTAE